MLNETVQDKLLQLLSTVESLQQSLSQNELEIRTRTAQIKAAREQLGELEAAVQQVDARWPSAPEPQESPDMIQSARVRQKSDTMILDEDYQQLRDSFIRCQTELDSLRKELGKSEKAIKEKHERTVELWHEPLEQKEEEISLRVRENEHLLNTSKQALAAMDQWLLILGNQSRIMDTHVENRVPLREVPEELQLSVRESCETLVEDWLQRSKESAASGQISPAR